MGRQPSSKDRVRKGPEVGKEQKAVQHGQMFLKVGKHSRMECKAEVESR